MTKLELSELPEPVMAQFDRLPLPMQMRVAAGVLTKVLERFGEHANRTDWWSPGSWRHYADEFDREDAARAALVPKCSLCRRRRTLDDPYDYNPIQVITGKPLGWYSGDDGELCPECMTKTLRGQ